MARKIVKADKIVKSEKIVKSDYDDEFDILYIYKDGKKAKFSVEVLSNFVIDVGFKGEVVAIEIFDASKVLKVPRKELKSIKAAKLATLARGNFYGVTYGMQLRNSSLESELQIPVGAIR